MTEYKIKTKFKEEPFFDYYTKVALLLNLVKEIDPTRYSHYEKIFNYDKNTITTKLLSEETNGFNLLLETYRAILTHSSDKKIINQFVSIIEERTNFLSENAEMIKIKSGSFQMGNTRNDKEASYNETPVHPVEITYDYWIGKHQITDYEYIQYLKDQKEQIKRHKGWKNRLAMRAVIDVTFEEAKTFCNWLSDQTGLKRAYTDEGHLKDIEKSEGYRLPTEAEWEYAARGGHKKHLDLPYSGHKDPFKVAWFYKNAQRRVHEVGKKKPNILGLHDMSGNVFEWCEDNFDDYHEEKQTNPVVKNESKFMIVRGGCWMLNPENGRVSSRFSAYSSKYNFVGFRLCRTAL